MADTALQFSGRDDLVAWLREQAPEAGIAIAARAALRVLPVLRLALDRGGPDLPPPGETVVLPVFRAVAVAWIAARYPAQREALVRAADAASDAADRAADAIRSSSPEAAEAADAAADAAAAVAVGGPEAAGLAADAVDAAASAAAGAGAFPVWESVSADAWNLSEGARRKR